MLFRSLKDWDRIGEFVHEKDPSQHLESIHNFYDPPQHKDTVKNWYDHTKPWITHLSIQSDNVFIIPKWIKEYQKPVIDDECRYEGNIEFGWGTPKGDLYKLPYGASVLDFAFNIHSNLGIKCTGAKVNEKNERLNYKLKSGDTVEILTSSTQVPKLDWLNFVVTSKARNKIRQTVHEMNNRSATLGKELVEIGRAHV